MVDRIDPMELAAVGVTAVVVKDLIDATPDFIAKLNSELRAPSTAEKIIDVAVSYNPIINVANLFVPDQIAQIKAWAIKIFNQNVSQGAGTR